MTSQEKEIKIYKQFKEDYNVTTYKFYHFIKKNVDKGVKVFSFPTILNFEKNKQEIRRGTTELITEMMEKYKEQQ